MTASEILTLAEEMAADAPADPVAWLLSRARGLKALKLRRVGPVFHLCTVEVCSRGWHHYFNRDTKNLSVSCANGWCDDADQLIREAEAAGFEVRR